MKDAIIILAGGVNTDGSLPIVPKQRVQKGVELWKGGVSKFLIMSGKYGFWIDELKQVLLKSESQAMKEYAVSLGVPADQVFIENESKDTVGNAYFVKVNYLEKNNWRNVVIVTSDFHLERTKLIFDLVLGHEYKAEYVPVSHGFSSEEKKYRDGIEIKTVSVLKEIVGSIEPGDTEAVREMLFTRHPGYAKNPEISLEQLKQMLGRGMKE